MEGKKKKAVGKVGCKLKEMAGTCAGSTTDRVRRQHTSLARSLWRSPSACQAVDWDNVDEFGALSPSATQHR